jgi:drug/metabolite transporter (DMT)-like permease
MYPLWVAVLSWPLLGIAPSRGTWLAAGIGVLGVAVLSWPVAQGGTLAPTESVEQLDTEGLLAIGAALLSAFTSGIALIGLHRLKELDARAVVVHFSGVGLAGCLLAVSVLPHDRPSVAWSNSALLMLLGVGLSATAGQIFLTKAFAAGEPARISVVGLSQIGFAVLLERMLHPRSYSLLTLVGMAMIVAPTIWVLLGGNAAYVPLRRQLRQRQSRERPQRRSAAP